MDKESDSKKKGYLGWIVAIVSNFGLIGSFADSVNSMNSWQDIYQYLLEQSQVIVSITTALGKILNLVLVPYKMFVTFLFNLFPLNIPESIQSPLVFGLIIFSIIYKNALKISGKDNTYSYADILLKLKNEIQLEQIYFNGAKTTKRINKLLLFLPKEFLVSLKSEFSLYLESLTKDNKSITSNEGLKLIVVLDNLYNKTTNVDVIKNFHKKKNRDDNYGLYLVYAVYLLLVLLVVDSIFFSNNQSISERLFETATYFIVIFLVPICFFLSIFFLIPITMSLKFRFGYKMTISALINSTLNFFFFKDSHIFPSNSFYNNEFKKVLNNYFETKDCNN